MHGVLHPKNDIDSVYLSREMGGRRLINCEGSVRIKKNKKTKNKLRMVCQKFS